MSFCLAQAAVAFGVQMFKGMLLALSETQRVAIVLKGCCGFATNPVGAEDCAVS